jgi:hypothetical protein
MTKATDGSRSQSDTLTDIAMDSGTTATVSLHHQDLSPMIDDDPHLCEAWQPDSGGPRLGLGGLGAVMELAHLVECVPALHVLQARCSTRARLPFATPGPRTFIIRRQRPRPFIRAMSIELYPCTPLIAGSARESSRSCPRHTHDLSCESTLRLQGGDRQDMGDRECDSLSMSSMCKPTQGHLGPSRKEHRRVRTTGPCLMCRPSGRVGLAAPSVRPHRCILATAQHKHKGLAMSKLDLSDVANSLG